MINKDPKLTEQLRIYLEADPAERDIRQGALLLLKLSGNRVAYNMILRAPQKFASMVETQLRKYYNFRVREITHQQVKEMEKKVEKIVEENISLSVAAEEGPKAGRRQDHDSLPENIQQLFEDNLEIIVKMRRLHKKLRELSLEDAPCPDSERYPFLKELIALDKKMHDNWRRYDAYIPTPPTTKTARRTEK